MESKPLDFTNELTQLLKCVSMIAIEIRLYSAYGSNSINNPKAPKDLEYLSDSIHNLGWLGDAIRGGEAEQIIFACDHHIAEFERYKNMECFQHGYSERGLMDGLSACKKIKEKVMGE